MQIDWLTVGAQWINFLILMWLLRRFLYRPIVQAMDKRQQAIAARTAEAESKSGQAEQLARDYRGKLAELEAQRAELLAAAREAADTERAKLIAQARAGARTQAEQWRLDIQREKAALQTHINRQLGGLITATARKAMQDLCSLSLEQALCSHFLERLQQLPEREKRLFTEPAHTTLVLASSFELDEAMRNRFGSTLRNILTSDVSLRFDGLRDSSLGLALTGANYTLEWTLEHYFADLRAELDDALSRANPNSPTSNPPAHSETPPSIPRPGDGQSSLPAELRQ